MLDYLLTHFVLYLEMYAIVSVIIGVSITMYIHFTYPEFASRTVGDSGKRVAEKLLQKRGIQKEVYGDRTVYYPVNDSSSDEVVRQAKHIPIIAEKFRFIFFIAYICTGIVFHAIYWPKGTYILVRSFMSKYFH